MMQVLYYGCKSSRNFKAVQLKFVRGIHAEICMHYMSSTAAY